MSPLDRELERALARRAQDTTPPGDLYAGVEHRAGRIRRRRQATVAGAALSLLALAVAVPLALRGGAPRDEGFVNPVPTSSESVPPTPDATPTTGPSATASPAPAGVSTPVYYAGEVGDGFRLYREFHLTAGGPAAAVREMLSASPADPDYRTLWPQGTEVRGVTVAGDVADVDLSEAARRTTVGSEAAHVAVQQLVYTVTAADNSITKVRILVEGRPVAELWGSVDTSEPIPRAPEGDVVAMVWLLDPLSDASVGRTFTLGGTANVYEANVMWDVLVACAPGTTGCAGAGRVLVKDFATATAGSGERGSWNDTATLPADLDGVDWILVRAFGESGENGSPVFVDTKLVRLRR